MKPQPSIVPLLIFSILLARHLSSACNIDILTYYGLQGVSSPTEYSSQISDIGSNYCPEITSSCCSLEDWDNTVLLWQTVSANIILVLKQYFTLLQNISIIQQSVLPILADLQATPLKVCRQIDETFFKTPIKFDQVHFIIKAAFEGFSLLQRGFYCTICDSDNHSYFSSGNPYQRLMIGVDRNFCPVIIDLMRDFLNYKLFYFDPMIINMNSIIDCSDAIERSYFDNSYRVRYPEIVNCLTNNIDCDSLCNEFRFGSTSNLWIGKLSEYKNTYYKFIKMLKKYNPNFVAPSSDTLDQGDVSTEFFSKVTLDPRFGPLNGNLSRYDILLQDRGVSPFDIGTVSGYFYVDASSPVESNTVVNQTPKITVVDPAQISANMVSETEDKLAVLTANNLAPESSEANSLTGNVDTYDTQFESDFMTESDMNPNDMSAAGINQNLPSS